MALQLVPGLLHTEPCSEICGSRFILQLTKAAGGRNMRKLITSTVAKMTRSISQGARMVSTMISSMARTRSCKAKYMLHYCLSNRQYSCRDVFILASLCWLAAALAYHFLTLRNKPVFPNQRPLQELLISLFLFIPVRASVCHQPAFTFQLGCSC